MHAARSLGSPISISEMLNGRKRQSSKEYCLYKGRVCGGAHSAVQLQARATQRGFGQSGMRSQGPGDKLLLNEALSRQM